MAGHTPATRRSSGGEPIEYRRQRMRIAQQKHRARKEQTIVDLEEQLEASQAKLSNITKAFDHLDARIHASYSTAEVTAALEKLRQSVHGVNAQPPNSDVAGVDNDANYLTAPKAIFDAGTLQVTPDAPGPFATQLYDYCINFAHHMVTGGNGPYRRLILKAFHHHLLSLDGDAAARLQKLSNGLADRITRMRMSRHDVKERQKMWKILKKGRLPGYAHHFDVAQVEIYLKRKHITFSSDLSTMYIPINVGARDIVDLDDFASAEDASTEDATVFDDAQVNIESWRSLSDEFDFSAYMTPDQSDSQHSTPETPPSATVDPNLPFGMLDDGGTEVVIGFGEPPSPAASEASSDASACFGRDPYSGSHTKQFNHRRDSVQDTIILEVQTSQLLRKLASVSVCIGMAGPGFSRNDVDTVLAGLTAVG